MADLSDNAYLRIWGKVYTDKWGLDSSAAQVIYRGHPMLIDIGTDTLYLKSWDDREVVATDIFIGIAAEPKSIAIGASEALSILEIYVGPTVVGFPGSTYTDADVGKLIYMSDSGTLSTTVADNPWLGTLIRVRDGHQYVQLRSPVICSGA